jgi:hypothetical protein
MFSFKLLTIYYLFTKHDDDTIIINFIFIGLFSLFLFLFPRVINRVLLLKIHFDSHYFAMY